MFEIIVYWLLVVLGTVGLAYGFRELRRALASRRWPVEEATVVEASIRRTRGAMTGTRYSPVIRYEYRRNGMTHNGDQIMFSGLNITSSRNDAERFVEPWAPGSTIHVRVSPSNPKSSVIQPGVDRRLVLMLFVSSYICFMGVGGILGWWK